MIIYIEEKKEETEEERKKERGRTNDRVFLYFTVHIEYY